MKDYSYRDLFENEKQWLEAELLMHKEFHGEEYENINLIVMNRILRKFDEIQEKKHRQNQIEKRVNLADVFLYIWKLR